MSYERRTPTAPPEPLPQMGSPLSPPPQPYIPPPSPVRQPQMGYGYPPMQPSYMPPPSPTHQPYIPQQPYYAPPLPQTMDAAYYGPPQGIPYPRVPHHAAKPAQAATPEQTTPAKDNGKGTPAADKEASKTPAKDAKLCPHCSEELPATKGKYYSGKSIGVGAIAFFVSGCLCSCCLFS